MCPYFANKVQGDYKYYFRFFFLEIGMRSLSPIHIYYHACIVAIDFSFPFQQRPPFFSFKMGLPSASLQALKLSTAAYFFSTVLSLLLPYKFKGQVTMGKVLAEHIIFYMAVFVIFLCWELNHHLHQVSSPIIMISVANFFAF